MTITLDITLREASLESDSLEVVRIVKPSWDPGSIKSKLLTGGISNKLIGFFLEGKWSKEVILIKMYGTNTESMIDRGAEIDTMKLLHSKGCGPELYAVFRNGICYEFIQGDTLSMEDVRSPEIYPIVAAEIAKVHSNIPPGGPSSSTGCGGVESKMWKKMRTFNFLVEDILKNNPLLVSRLSAFGFDISSGFGSRAIDEMEQLLESQGMPLTFCHNDLLLGNVVYNKETRKVSFIDFEYAMTNYAPFDVANHFNEFAGIDTPDFSKCPDPSFRSQWIGEYLKHFRAPGMEVVDRERFERWVELCSPASHLFWALWAIVQAQNSTIDFDFAGYFGLRYTEYEREMGNVRKGL